MNRDLITSTRNQHVAFFRALRRSRSRRNEAAYLIEGVRLAGEALDAGIVPLVALYDPRSLETSELGRRVMNRIADTPGAFAASEPVVGAAGETRTTQGIVLAARQPPPLPRQRVEGQPLLLVLDGVADGGNAGTILRSAAAAGVTTVVFTGAGVDPWLGKVVRSGMGAHFRVGIAEMAWPDLLVCLGAYPQVVLADANGAVSIYDINWREKTVLVIGSETHGVSDPALDRPAVAARIPHRSDVESLNAAMAATVILFHAARA